jgi:hypothetical protein
MLSWGGGRRGGTFWPCPSSSHGSCCLVLGPAGWFVLHRHSVEPLSLSVAYCAAANVSGDRPVRAKIGTAPAAWTAWTRIAPIAHKVVEGDG